MKRTLLNLFLYSAVMALSGLLHAGVAPAPVSLGAETTERSMLEDALAPEVSFRYDYDFPMSLQSGQGEYSMHEYRAAIPLPPVISKTFVMVTSLNYRLFEADVDTDLVHSTFDLHTLRLPVQAAWLSPTSPWLVIGYVEPGISTDFSVVDRDSMDLTAALGVGYRFSDNFMVALGGGYSRNYGEDQALPAFALLWKASDQFTLTMSPDGVVPEWRITDDWRLRLRLDFIGGRWTIQDDESAARQLELQGASLSLLVEHRLFEKCWMTLGAGFNTMSSLRLEDSAGAGIVDSDLDEALVIRSGLKWKF